MTPHWKLFLNASISLMQQILYRTNYTKCSLKNSVLIFNILVLISFLTFPEKALLRIRNKTNCVITVHNMKDDGDCRAKGY